MVLPATNDEKDVIHDDTALDFHGNLVDKSKTGGWLAAGLILGTELSERICVVGIIMNLVTYLRGDLHLPSAKSATIVTNFLGTLYLLGLLGGFLADAKLGRYLAVAIFGSIAAVGGCLLTIATTIHSMRPPACNNYEKQRNQCIEASGGQLAMLYAALYTIALGFGGIKSNVPGLGSDQFDQKDPKEEKAMTFFFNRFVFCITMGSLFAAIVLVYVQDYVGRGWGYGVAAGTTVMAVAIFFCGTPWYRFKKPQGSPLTVIWRVLLLAWKKRSHPHPSNLTILNGYQNNGVSYTQRFKCLDKAAIVADRNTEEGRNDPWLASTLAEVEQVKMVLKLLPIWSTCILPWTVYSQMTTFTIEQATFMNTRVGSVVIPEGSFSSFLIISILLCTSLNERLIVPLARKLTHNPQGLTSLQRIGIGLMFSIVGMVVSAIIEKQRRETVVRKNHHTSAFWLLPQLFLVGAADAFSYVGQLEFFIREAPERMKSMSTGLFMSTLSMGFFFSSLLVTIVNKVTEDVWLRSDFNKGNLDYFYWLLAALGVLNYFVFLVFARAHQYKVRQSAKSDNFGEEKPKPSNDQTMVVMKEEGMN